MFLLGSAGTGKSRTVRSFVGACRDVVRAEGLAVPLAHKPAALVPCPCFGVGFGVEGSSG